LKEDRTGHAYLLHQKNIVVVFLGVAVGTIIIMASNMDPKWGFALIFGVIGFFSYFIFFSNSRRFFLFFATFLLSIRLDFYFFYKETSYVQLQGFPISLFDLIFLFLLNQWLIQLIILKKRLRFYPSISLPMLLFIFFSGLSVLKADDKLLSLSMLALTVKGYLVFLYFSNNIRKKEEIIWVVVALSTCMVIQSIVGFMQYMTGGTLGLGQLFGEFDSSFKEGWAGSKGISRVGGLIGTPNGLAMYLNSFIPVLLCFLFTDQGRRFRTVIGLVMLMGMLAQLLTFSRGGWVAFCIGMLITLCGLFWIRFGGSIKALVIGGTSFVVVLVLVFSLSGSVRNRLIEDDYGSAYSRIPMMMVAVNIIKDKPVTGVGLNNYTVEMHQYDFSRRNISYTFPFPVHNAYLIIAAESGIFALLSFIWVLLAASKKSLLFLKSGDKLPALIGLGFSGGIVSWCVHVLVKIDYIGLNNNLWFTLGIIVALHCILSEDMTVLKNKNQ
jgi:O-antigen ligase